jgi:hypothetical protein
MYCYTDRPDLFNSTINVIPINHQLCERQWYKIDFFKPGFVQGEDPIIIMDLDWTIYDEVDSILDVPIEKNEFYAVDRWWRGEDDPLEINGGMYKVYPNTCTELYNIFYKDPTHWQSTYKQKHDITAVIGEQNFVFEHIRNTHTLKKFPGIHLGRNAYTLPLRTHSSPTRARHLMIEYAEIYMKKFNQSFYYGDEDWNPNIIMMHG